jgi:hypothetical protein
VVLVSVDVDQQTNGLSIDDQVNNNDGNSGAERDADVADVENQSQADKDDDESSASSSSSSSSSLASTSSSSLYQNNNGKRCKIEYPMSCVVTIC